MSYTYGFFDAVDLGSDNYDRVYSSAEFSHYWALLVGDGVFGQPSTSLNVLAMEPVAMRVKVAPGTGWIKGHYLTVPDNMEEVISIQVANPSLPRIDSIIMALNNPDRDMKLYVRSGTAAASPQAVTLQRDADVWELELAQITVAAGAGNITQQAIKDMRTDPNRCGIVTGLIDQFDVSGFFTAAQASFNEWFENVQGQLDGDVAGNLQNQINKNAEGIATINATTLKADTKTALGLPASAGPDDAFKVLANVGNLHVWERVQTYAEGVPAIYSIKLNDPENDVYTGGSDRTSTLKMNVSSSVHADGLSVVMNDPVKTSFTLSAGGALPDAISGKYIDFRSDSYTTNYEYVYYIPPDATITYNDYMLKLNGIQRVTAYKVSDAIPSGTTTDYLTSTDRNAYPDNVTDAQDAYYTLGDVVSNVSFGADGNPYIHYDVSDNVVVDESGNVTLGDTTRVVIGYGYNGTTDTVKSALAGKFIKVYANEYSGSSDTHTFIPKNTIAYIPSDVSITQDGLGPKHFIGSYQPVTGHAAIPSNITITYLGQLGGGARIEVGSYVGTGTDGSANPNKLTFLFEPKLLIIRNAVSSNERLFLSIVKSGRYVSFLLSNSGSNAGSNTGGITLSGNTVSWYAGGPHAQMNASKTTYNYIAIG